MRANKIVAKSLILIALASLMVVSFTPLTAKQANASNPVIELVEIGRYYGTGAEISAYDPMTKRLFVTGGGANVEVLDLSNPANPVLVDTLPFDATSVAVKNGVLAVAVPNPADITLNGHVYLYNDLASLENPVVVEVGALPDMLTFTPDGKRILVANEGERGDLMDPEGSVSIINVSRGIEKAIEKKATFGRFNNQRDRLVAQGVRIFPDAQSVAQDLEPEYIAISADGKTAWITLQENNSIAVLHIPAAAYLKIVPLGLKDYSLPGKALDASDRDGNINIQNWPVNGMYMPDGIAAYQLGEKTLLITANEGDDRGETSRVSGLTLDPAQFADAATLQKNANLGRLTVSTIDGDANGDGLYEKLYAYGARSFSIWNANGQQIFDSGDQLEELTSASTPSLFNADNGDPALLDTRSDNKGPEPEGVAVASIKGNSFAFIGLERAGGGVMVYNVSNPQSPSFVQYVRADQDVAPEGLLFVSAEDSPSGSPLLVVTNEASKTTTIYEIHIQ
jgi:DNA-binding beta-propeller fold protein YncE